jgi:hypothetical protein
MDDLQQRASRALEMVFAIQQAWPALGSAHWVALREIEATLAQIKRDGVSSSSGPHQTLREGVERFSRDSGQFYNTEPDRFASTWRAPQEGYYSVDGGPAVKLQPGDPAPEWTWCRHCGCQVNLKAPPHPESEPKP